MKLEDMITQPFHRYSIKDWTEKAEQSLKGKQIKDLHTSTYEKIELKPLYTVKDITTDRMSYGTKKENNDWRIAQKITGNSFDQLHEQLHKSITNGQDSIAFSLQNIHAEGEQLEKLLDYNLPFCLLEKETVKKLHLLKQNKIFNASTGIMGYDLLSSELAFGYVINEESKEKAEWIDTVTFYKNNAPNLKTLVVNTVPYEQGGANAIQQLSFALTTAVQYIEWLTKEGWTLEEINEKLVFHFAIGSQFFMEIAKIRAFTVLWKTVLQAYGLETKEFPLISAETTNYTKSALDPYVNMLRAGGEAFAAVISGIDYLHVSPYNEAYAHSNDFSQRIARNIQHILKEEVHIGKVVDPGAGSYYIESMTKEIGERAWKYFTEIEDKGGILHHIKTGDLQEEVNAVLQVKQNDLANRKHYMIGTNIYANLLDELIDVPAGDLVKRGSLESFSEIRPIIPTRASEKFEKLRLRAYMLQESGHPLQAGLICLQSLKRHKARADFVSGFLAVGGIEVVQSSECFTTEDVEKFINENPLKYYVICGNDEDYKDMVADILAIKMKLDSEITIDIAGKQSSDLMQDWKKKGLFGDIFSGQNILEKHTELFSILKGEDLHE